MQEKMPQVIAWGNEPTLLAFPFELQGILPYPGFRGKSGRRKGADQRPENSGQVPEDSGNNRRPRRDRLQQ